LWFSVPELAGVEEQGLRVPTDRLRRHGFVRCRGLGSLFALRVRRLLFLLVALLLGRRHELGDRGAHGMTDDGRDCVAYQGQVALGREREDELVRERLESGTLADR